MKVGLPSKKNQQVRVGETVEVLVLSDIKSLSRFMAVRDVYLPDMDLWLSEDPCIERPVFENLIETLRAGSSSSTSVTPALKVNFQHSILMHLEFTALIQLRHNWEVCRTRMASLYYRGLGGGNPAHYRVAF